VVAMQAVMIAHNAAAVVDILSEQIARRLEGSESIASRSDAVGPSVSGTDKIPPPGQNPPTIEH